MNELDTNERQVEEQAGSLRDYLNLKLDLAAIIRSVKELFHQAKDPREQQARLLLSHLAEDRFNLAVVGQFKRGKSSLMNAVIGMDRLPTGILPLTSVVTTVRYDDEEKVIIKSAGSSLPLEVSLENLEEYVTEKGNAGNRRRVEVAEVLLPAEILRLGFHFIDTPGVGSSIAENTATTHRFLPQADAVVFVTSFESTMNEGELAFLGTVAGHVHKIFVVVNKLDLVTREESEAVLASLHQALSGSLGVSNPRIFAVSARLGLEAKLSGNTEMLDLSGLQELESALTDFLTKEREQTSLLRCIERAMRLLADGGPGPSDQAEGLFCKLETMHVELGDKGNNKKRILPSVVWRQRRIIRRCLVCERIEEDLFDFFRMRQYQLHVSDAEHPGQAAIGGFCPVHTWQYAKIASAQDICLTYAPLLASAASRLRRIAASEASIGSMRDLVRRLNPSKESCPACLRMLKTESVAVEEFRKTTNEQNDEELDAGLCVHHMASLLKREMEVETARKFILEEARIFDGISEDMRTYALKRDALRSDLVNEGESSAYFIALALLSGLPKSIVGQ